jgi:hypothetical protein
MEEGFIEDKRIQEDMESGYREVIAMLSSLISKMSKFSNS